MTVFARAPGKLVILGEYAVLAGAPALVAAVDRHCTVSLGPSSDTVCRLETRAAVSSVTKFTPGAPSGVEMVDCVTQRWPARTRAPWSATLDSSALFGGRGKLGLGSSAAAMTAWAGAWSAHTGRPPPDVHAVIELHRAWQRGGSGLDVAASRLGGVLSYRQGPDRAPEIVSEALPEGVGFVGVFSGRASSTRDFVARFGAWREREPRAAGEQLQSMCAAAERGICAARANAVDAFLAAAAAYAKLLDELGKALGADIMTVEHRAIAAIAARCGVTYKVSGAGGGDVGVALAAEPAALEAFTAALPPGCEALRLEIDDTGLFTEERST